MTDLGLTPSQTVGPYLHIGLLGGPFTNRLVDESDPRAIHVRGVLLDSAGVPIPDGLIEVWQANAAGRYAHPADDREVVPIEDGFTGFGRSGTEVNGQFEFVTVKPGQVPWLDGRNQAPHLVFGVFARGLLKRVVTRMYFPDEEAANAEDPVLLGLDPQQRATLVSQPEEDGVRFNIVLQGDRQTTFFAV